MGFWLFQDRKFRPSGRNFRGGRKFRPTGGISGPSANSTKSFLGSLSGGVPELSPGNFRWFGTSGQWKFRLEKRLSHIWDPSLEGSRNFPPEVTHGNFRWAGNSGLQAGSSGLWKFLVEIWLSHFWDPSLEGSRNRSEERRVGKECTSWCRSRWSPYH